MLTFQWKYLLPAVILFFVELVIAFFVHDTIVRPFIGDFLVVVLMYCFLKSFFQLPVYAAAGSVLLFAYLIEILQYFKLIYRLGWQDSLMAHLILGSKFHWVDMLMYTAGILLVIFAESVYKPKREEVR
jgi:hypothetical protein